MLTIEQVRQLLLDLPQRVVITTHTNPDADALGSSLGLYHYLRRLGHQVTVITPNQFPSYLAFLPDSKDIVVYEQHNGLAKQLIADADIIFALDYNALSRVKDMRKDIMENTRAVKLMIDHHLQPEDFTQYTLSVIQASSTAELIFDFIRMIDHQAIIHQDMATCLYAGIIADTGRFKFSLSPKVFQTASSLLECQIDTEYINNQIFDCFSEDRLRLFGFSLLERMNVLNEYNTAYIYLSKKDMGQFNYQIGDIEGLVNYPLSIAHVRFAVLFKEDDYMIKLSLRSKGNFSVNEFARNHFEGGGHKNAAGGSCRLPLFKSIARFEDLLAQYQSELTDEPN